MSGFGFQFFPESLITFEFYLNNNPISLTSEYLDKFDLSVVNSLNNCIFADETINYVEGEDSSIITGFEFENYCSYSGPKSLDKQGFVC